MRSIVGIVLVRNEDLHVRRAVLNVLDFCDILILADNGSTDGTTEILQELAARSPEKCRYHRLTDPSQSHDLVSTYAGQPVWIFAVDGDEIYDSERLAAFRPRLLAGEYDSAWMLVGNALHCTALDSSRCLAEGHLAPPSRSITKLHNFAAISSWTGDTPERLHGGDIIFRPGFDHASKRNLHLEADWDHSLLRCLHLCFLRRSSSESGTPVVRENIMELRQRSISGMMRRWMNRLLGRSSSSTWKRDFYRRGPVVSVDAAPFQIFQP